MSSIANSETCLPTLRNLFATCSRSSSSISTLRPRISIRIYVLLGSGDRCYARHLPTASDSQSTTEGDGDHPQGAGLAQRPRRCRDRGAGGEDVVDEDGAPRG